MKAIIQLHGTQAQAFDRPPPGNSHENAQTLESEQSQESAQSENSMDGAGSGSGEESEIIAMKAREQIYECRNRMTGSTKGAGT